MSKEPEGTNPKEPDDAFIGEFYKIATENILKQYEAKNRERISSASLMVRDAFDKQWEKVTGKRYYQPVTTAPKVQAFTSGQNNVEFSDPRSRTYRAKVSFTNISWQKLPRRKIGKKFKDLYNLKGVESATKDWRACLCQRSDRSDAHLW